MFTEPPPTKPERIQKLSGGPNGKYYDLLLPPKASRT